MIIYFLNMFQQNIKELEIESITEKVKMLQINVKNMEKSSIGNCNNNIP